MSSSEYNIRVMCQTINSKLSQRYERYIYGINRKLHTLITTITESCRCCVSACLSLQAVLVIASKREEDDCMNPVQSVETSSSSVYSKRADTPAALYLIQRLSTQNLGSESTLSTLVLDSAFKPK